MEIETMILHKQYETILSYLREAHKEASAKGVIPPTHNKFYEYIKNDLSQKVTRVTNAHLAKRDL